MFVQSQVIDPTLRTVYRPFPVGCPPEGYCVQAGVLDAVTACRPCFLIALGSSSGVRSREFAPLGGFQSSDMLLHAHRAAASVTLTADRDSRERLMAPHSSPVLPLARHWPYNVLAWSSLSTGDPSTVAPSHGGARLERFTASAIPRRRRQWPKPLISPGGVGALHEVLQVQGPSSGNEYYMLSAGCMPGVCAYTRRPEGGAYLFDE